MVSKTSKRIFGFLMVIVTAYVFFLGYKKVFPAKNVDAEKDTSMDFIKKSTATSTDHDDMDTPTLSDEERCCCQPPRRLSYGKHHFRALGSCISSCANVVCVDAVSNEKRKPE